MEEFHGERGVEYKKPKKGILRMKFLKRGEL